MLMNLLGDLRSSHLFASGYYHKHSWIDLQACTLSRLVYWQFSRLIFTRHQAWILAGALGIWQDFCVVLHSISIKSWDSTLIRPWLLTSTLYSIHIFTIHCTVDALQSAVLTLTLISHKYETSCNNKIVCRNLHSVWVYIVCYCYYNSDIE
jgi:hypothetical protein